MNQVRLARKSEKGVFLIFFALSIVVLFGFIGLAVDLSRQMSDHTEMQNAADACSTAAASELNGLSDSLLRAEQAGIFVGNKNLQDFQSAAITLQPSDISYSTSLNGPFLDNLSSPNPASTFVKCNVHSDSFINYFAGLIGINNPIITATSVATLTPSQSSCALPMAMNKGAGSADFGYAKGDLINFVMNKVGSATGSVSGTTLTITGSPTSFIAVNSTLSPSPIPAGTKVIANISGAGLAGTYQLNNSFTLSSRTITVTAPVNNSFYWASATDVSSANLAIQRAGICNQPTILNTNMTTPTFPNTIIGFEDAWNSHFGLYRTGGPQLNLTTLPDLSGYYIKSPTSTFWSDYAANRAPNRTQATALTSISPSATYGIIANATVNNGASNRRYVALPVLSGNSLQGWACMLMVHPELKTSSSDSGSAQLQYLGRAESLDSPCRSFGISGGGGAIGPLVPTIIQ